MDNNGYKIYVVRAWTMFLSFLMPWGLKLNYSLIIRCLWYLVEVFDLNWMKRNLKLSRCFQGSSYDFFSYEFMDADKHLYALRVFLTEQFPFSSIRKNSSIKLCFDWHFMFFDANFGNENWFTFFMSTWCSMCLTVNLYSISGLMEAFQIIINSCYCFFCTILIFRA